MDLFSEEYMKELFDQFDLDNTGFITKDNLECVLKSLEREAIYVDKIISQVDVNGDGQLSFKEFAGIMEDVMKHDKLAQDLMDAFATFDVDDSGYITADNIRETLESLGQNPSEEDITEMIFVADFKGNGIIDYEEFVHLLTLKR